MSRRSPSSGQGWASEVGGGRAAAEERERRRRRERRSCAAAAAVAGNVVVGADDANIAFPVEASAAPALLALLLPREKAQ